MIRRSTAVVVLVAASIAPLASAADLKSNIRAVSQMNKSALKLGPLFQKGSDKVEILPDGGVMAEPTYPHVMVVAVTAEGDTVSSCAVSEEAAAKTLEKAAKPQQLDLVKEQ
jgi:hypothetical protein